MKKVIIITEANEKVASGHLMECIVCAAELKKAGYQVEFFINSDMPMLLKERIPNEYHEYCKRIEEDSDILFEYLKQVKASVLLLNLREVSNAFLTRLQMKKDKNTKIICIDEFGHRRLDADIIINPMIPSWFWKYDDSKARLYCGEEFLVLSPELEKYHEKQKEIKKEIKRVTVTMGGVDIHGFTLKLARFLPDILPFAEIHLVIGGGFPYGEQLETLIQGKQNITVHRNIDYLYELIFQSDLVFCAGGNTLHETACIGTAAVIIPSMPHERMNARVFCARGFGLYLENEDFAIKDLKEAADTMNDPEIRRKMLLAGRQTIDGRGYKRVVKIIGGIMNEDSFSGLGHL